MAKWALLAANSQVEAGAAVPRTVGANGRPLQRPWRMASVDALRVARMQRRTRPQPWWPRCLGAACLVAAGWFAMHPIDLHVAAMSSASPVGKTRPLRTLPAALPGLWPPFVFRWQAGDAKGPFTWVLLDAGYEEINRREGLFESAFAPDTAVREQLAGLDTCHWFVLATVGGVARKSPLETLSIR